MLSRSTLRCNSAISVRQRSLSFISNSLRNGRQYDAHIGLSITNKISTAPVKFPLLKHFFSTQSSSSEPAKKYESKPGFFNLSLESNIASPTFTNRWAMLVPAVFTHLCIGSPFAWSLMADLITRHHGFVASAASDWTLGESALPLSIILGIFGVTSAIGGKWQLKIGARKSMSLAALCFGSGVALGGAAIHLHSLPLLYLGYGCLGGIGIGLAYTPPLQALMQWFPDKKGLASGLTIAGFGSGALIFAPLVQMLTKKFAVMPKYLGPASEFTTKMIDGRLFAEIDGQLTEVLNAGSQELAKIPFDLAEGLYVVGTGSSGAVEALTILGAGYFATILASAMIIKSPHPTYKAPVAVVTASSPAKVVDVSVDTAFMAPQFHLLGITFFCLATGGIGMLSVAKPMMSEVFSAAMPAVVTSAFAAKFVLMLSGGNMGGRLGWAAVSDAIGRRSTFLIFTTACVPLYLAMPSLVESVVNTGSVAPLYGFCASATLAVSCMGGVYALLPAYESDLFGTKFVGAIHGRMLLYSSAAAVCGPSLLIYLRSISERAAIQELLTKVTPESFQSAFGAGMDQASALMTSKALTINKLLVLAPPGTLDPTPHLYDTTMYALGGLMSVAVLSHYMVRPLQLPPVAAVITELKETQTAGNNDSNTPDASTLMPASKDALAGAPTYSATPPKRSTNKNGPKTK